MTNTALIDLVEARRRLGNISAGTIYNLIRDGDLPIVKLRDRTLVRPRDVDALVTRNLRIVER